MGEISAGARCRPLPILTIQLDGEIMRVLLTATNEIRLLVGRTSRGTRPPCEVVECGNGPLSENAPWPSSWTLLEALTARFDSLGSQVDGRLRPRVEGAG
eukprot:scaffold114397_cov36-Phaeocystis_antarctica.AAC.1